MAEDRFYLKGLEVLIGGPRYCWQIAFVPRPQLLCLRLWSVSPPFSPSPAPPIVQLDRRGRSLTSAVVQNEGSSTISSWKSRYWFRWQSRSPSPWRPSWSWLRPWRRTSWCLSSSSQVVPRPLEGYLELQAGHELWSRMNISLEYQIAFAKKKWNLHITGWGCLVGHNILFSNVTF